MNKFIWILFLPVCVKSQDSLVLKNKSVTLASIEEIAPTSIKYKKFDNLEGPAYIVNKADVSYIRFKNGTKTNIDSLNKADANGGITVNQVGFSDSKSMYDKGCVDANRYYNHSGGSFGIGFSACACGLLGIIPAIIVANNPPKDKNLGIPLVGNWDNMDYRDGYIKTAHKMKRKKVWRGFGIGILTGFAFYLSAQLSVH